MKGKVQILISRVYNFKYTRQISMSVMNKLLYDFSVIQTICFLCAYVYAIHHEHILIFSISFFLVVVTFPVC